MVLPTTMFLTQRNTESGPHPAVEGVAERTGGGGLAAAEDGAGGGLVAAARPASTTWCQAWKVRRS